MLSKDNLQDENADFKQLNITEDCKNPWYASQSLTVPKRRKKPSE